MISLLNFIDTGFIITLGLLLLVSGAVMLYCYRRLNILENSLIEHGKILQNFIVNYNNQFLATQQNQLGGLESESTTNLQNQNRISVSDDEDDDEEEHDNGDEESDENLDEESDEESHEESDEEGEEGEEGEEEDLVIKNDSLSLKNEENPEDVFLTNLPIDLNELNLDSKIIKLETPETEVESTEKVNEKKNYSRMKVDELKTLVVTKDLTSTEEAHKMQKKDLIKLLQ
tara:strand:- start:2525 stop:3214 length:690 start_codon:yes stop_codon:yes gene_type:complete